MSAVESKLATIETVAGMVAILSWGFLIHINGFDPATSLAGLLLLAGLGGYRVMREWLERNNP